MFHCDPVPGGPTLLVGLVTSSTSCTHIFKFTESSYPVDQLYASPRSVCIALLLAFPKILIISGNKLHGFSNRKVLQLEYINTSRSHKARPWDTCGNPGSVVFSDFHSEGSALEILCCTVAVLIWRRKILLFLFRYSSVHGRKDLEV